MSYPPGPQAAHPEWATEIQRRSEIQPRTGVGEAIKLKAPARKKYVGLGLGFENSGVDEEPLDEDFAGQSPRILCGGEYGD